MIKALFLLWSIVLMTFILSNGQTIQFQNLPNNLEQFSSGIYPSPNAASLGLYGQIPVNYSSGIPDIKVPLHEVVYADTRVGVGLSYHPFGIAVESHPSWVGLGWSLNTGGCITRVIKGEAADETYWAHSPFPNAPVTFKGFYYQHQLLNTNNWLNDGYINSLNSIGVVANNQFTANSDFLYDGEPDEFIFNFGGYSGSFFLSETGEWRVKTSDNISIKIEETVTNFWLPSYLQGEPGMNLPSVFLKFIITDQNGYKYEFGGDANTVEFSRSLEMQSRDVIMVPSGFKYSILPSAWYLKKITTPTGESIAFNYERGEILLKKTRSANMMIRMHTDGFNCVSLNPGGGNYGMATNPVYIKSIETPFEKLTFFRSQSNELGYENAFFPEMPQNASNDIETFINSRMLHWEDIHYLRGYDVNNYFELPHKYQQLDSINITDKSTGYINKSYVFSYSSNQNVRLTLNSLTKLARVGIASPETYSFEYNHVENLPRYGTMKTDYWGFYNSNTQYTQISNPYTYPNWRPANATLSQTGVLKKINYPLGGATEFIWEQNRYQKYLVHTPNSISINYEPNEKLAGGLRIKKIISKTSFGAPDIEKEFFYHLGSQPSSSAVSSGTLAGVPTFIDHYTKKVGCGNNFPDVTFEFRSDNALHPISSATGSTVLYDQVQEKSSDGSFTTYKFSGFGYSSGVGENTGDELQTYKYVKQSDGSDSYSYRISSLDLERGKLNSKELYRNYSGIPILIEKYDYEYNKSSTRKDLYSKAMYLRLPTQSQACGNICGIASSEAVFACAYKNYYYPTYLTKEIRHQYFPTGDIVTVSDYSYDQYRNNISTKTSINNYESTIALTRYNSHLDYQSNSSTDAAAIGLKNLVNNFHILSAPVEQVLLNQDIYGNQRVLGGKILTYHPTLPVNVGIKTLNITDPLLANGSSPAFSYSFSDNNGFHNHSSYAIKTTAETLSLTGDYLGTKTDNLNSATTVGYQNQYVTSKTTNTPYQWVAHTSFEGQYTGVAVENFGNWSFDPNEIIDGGLTGKKAYQLHSGSFLTAGSGLQLQNGKQYIISYWGKNPNGAYVFVSNGVNMVAKKQVGDWTYYEGRFTHSGVNLELYGTGSPAAIDELRCYPADAQMESYTYDPLMGMTSKCDANNSLIYYEYDGFGRLAVIRNQDRSVAKKIEYKIQQPE